MKTTSNKTSIRGMVILKDFHSQIFGYRNCLVGGGDNSKFKNMAFIQKKLNSKILHDKNQNFEKWMANQ